MKLKISLEGNSRKTKAEEQISDLEDKRVEITSTKQNKETRMKIIKDSLTDVYDSIKCSNF